jgi:hypothetical protein
MNTSPLPVAKVRNASKGAEVRAIIEWAIAARERTLRYGWAHVEAAAARREMGMLRTWLDRHVFVSPEAAKQLYTAHAASIHYVMPSNAAGRTKLLRLQQIISSIS